MPIVLTDGVVVLFALWTVLCNAVVVLGGTAVDLSRAASAGAVAALGLLVLAWRRGWLAAALADARSEVVTSAVVVPPVARWLLAAGALASVALWFGARAGLSAWVLAALLMLAAVAVALRAEGGEAAEAPRDDGRSRRWLHVLAVATGLFTLLSFRPRTDDAFYLHMAVSLIDYPNQALLSMNTLHGAESASLGPQPMFPPYRVHSFELLGGFLAQLTGVEVATVIHLGLATLMGWLCPYAIARLLRILVPGRWLIALLAVVSFYLLEASAARGYSNQAFVRLFHGKSVLLTLGVPLLLAYGLRFGQRPTWARFVMLTCAQIGALGLSSTAIWMAPSLAFVAVAAGATDARTWLVRLPLAVASSVYVLAMGLWVASQLGPVRPRAPEPGLAGDPAATELPAELARLAEGIPIVLGGEVSAAAQLVAVALALALVRGQLTLRLFAALAALVTVLYGNPWLSDLIATSITGPVTYQRIFWLLPVPIAVGLCVVQALPVVQQRLGARLGGGVVFALLCSFYLVSSERIAISEANRSRLVFPPTVKLWPEARAVSRALCAHVGRQDVVLAPRAVSLQLPTLHECGAPVLADARWISADPADEERRERLQRYVSERGVPPREQTRWFLEGLKHYGVEAVTISKDATRSARLKSLLRKAGFVKVETVEWQFIYTRGSRQFHLQNRAVALRLCSLTKDGSVVLAPFGVSRYLDKLPCVKAALPGDWSGLPPEDDELRLGIERLLYMSKSLNKREARHLVDFLRDNDVKGVVVGPHAQANKDLKRLLPRAGYKRHPTLYGHMIYVMPLKQEAGDGG